MDDLAPSPALSILENGPDSLAGRKIGVLVSDGADAEILDRLTTAAEQQGVTVELIAPAVGAFQASDGSRREADRQIEGGPSVLYDAGLLLPSSEGASKLARKPAARDFVTDAYAHAKFIGCGSDAGALLEATGLRTAIDDGTIEVADGAAVERFLSRCRELRFWGRGS